MDATAQRHLDRFTALAGEPGARIVVTVNNRQGERARFDVPTERVSDLLLALHETSTVVPSEQFDHDSSSSTETED